MSLIELIPNFSDGRRASLVDALAVAAGGHGARLLDYSSDIDHNRSVFTLVGARDELFASMTAMIGIAVAAIDLRRHRGAHPCIGAVDVIPAVPLDADAKRPAFELIRSLADVLGRVHGIPAFFYERSASRPEHRDLAALRRGGLERLTERMRGGLSPDVGPPRPHPTAGACAVGVRDFLIAFNVLLDTPDVQVARAIARSMRQSSGGRPAVKALGLYLAAESRAQVSMNLVDFRRTSIFTAFEEVEKLASEHGCTALSSELIGLIPRAALAGGDVERLRLRQFDSSRVLEHRLDSG